MGAFCHQTRLAAVQIPEKSNETLKLVKNAVAPKPAEFVSLFGFLMLCVCLVGDIKGIYPSCGSGHFLSFFLSFSFCPWALEANDISLPSHGHAAVILPTSARASSENMESNSALFEAGVDTLRRRISIALQSAIPYHHHLIYWMHFKCCDSRQHACVRRVSSRNIQEFPVRLRFRAHPRTYHL